MSALTDVYASQLEQLELDLQNTTEFPVTVRLGESQYEFPIWQGELPPDRLLAYDCETAPIQHREIPELALVCVHGDSGSCRFIHPDDLVAFIRIHADRYWCCHNAVFDFWVTAQALQADPTACCLWWDVAGSARLYCTMLGDALIRLAKIDSEPINRDLGVVAADYCGLQLDKNDPYRLRYGELIGLKVTQWSKTPEGFWTYAAKDPIATLQVCQVQAKIASQLIEPYRAKLLPDALRRFGPLTACLQVQGAIALDYASRVGITVDLQQVQQLRTDISGLVEQYRQELEQLLPGCFKRYGSRSKQAGELQRTVAGVPRRDAKLIKTHLEQIAKTSDHAIRPGRNKDGLVTDSVKYWKQHCELDPFIAAYVAYSEQAKLTQFFTQLDQERVFPRYRPLVRTGRTSCSDPNLQQLPRDGRFREMIIAPPGYWLLQIDYSVLELRTLAQICLCRYGRSRLAELFQQGIDPHKYTAAQLLGLSLEQFEQLPKATQKQHRQASKAVGFGAPGGLGAAALVSYAKHAYGVEMTLEQARDFRQRLITEIYPELQAYLADNQHATLATNLYTTESLARQALPKWEQIKTAQRIISGCDATPEGEPYSSELVQHVWLLMRQLNCNPELMPELTARHPSSELMRRCFYRTVATISGRLRGHVGFSQAANSPFQGLAADGNKLALFRLLRAGYQVCGFIHDEMLILLPDASDYDGHVQRIQQILADAMQELTPDIPIATEFLLASAWYKDVDANEREPDTGRIIPYSRTDEQPFSNARTTPFKPKPKKMRKQLEPEQVWSFTAPPVDHPDLKQLRNESGAPARLAEPQLVKPFRYHGGKEYLTKPILALMQDHTHYCEPFAGGLSVLLAKSPYGISETVNDLDGEIINFWRVLADRQRFEQFYRQIECTPLAEPLFDAAADEANGSVVDRAVRFFIRVRQSRQGLQRDYVTPTRRIRRGMNEQVSAWLTSVAGLSQVHQRLLRVEIRHMPAIDCIRKYDHGNCVFYCDPPYLHETRSSTGEYAHEMTEDDHRELLECLAQIKGKFLLSGYSSQLYWQYANQHGWSCEQVEIDNKASSSKTKEKRTECIWFNYQVGNERDVAR